jgi:hypothetical protein
MIGAEGTVLGVTTNVHDSRAGPAALTALIFNIYLVPFVSPVNIMGLETDAGVRVTQDCPLLIEY